MAGARAWVAPDSGQVDAAKVVPAGPASPADAAGDALGQRDPVPRMEILHQRPDFLNHTRYLVAHHAGQMRIGKVASAV